MENKHRGCKEWIEVAKQLEKNSKHFEAWHSSYSYEEEIRALAGESKRFNASRNELQVKLKKKLEFLRGICGRIIADLRSDHSREMESQLKLFEEKLNLFKHNIHSSLVSLDFEIEALSSDLDASCEELLKFDEQKVEIEAVPRVQPKQRLQQDLSHQSEISAIDKKIVGIGGRHGGWDVRDNDMFLRALSKFGLLQKLSKLEEKLMKRLQEKLVREIPGKTVDEVHQHIDWYVAYQDLTEQKKRCIEAWKGEDELSKQSLNGQLAEGFEASAGSPNKVASKRDPTNSQHVKERIAEWRAKKRAEEEQRLQEEQSAELENQKRSEEERRRHAEKSKLQLQTWKQEEEDRKVQILRAQEGSHVERPKSVDPAEVRRRRSRDKMTALTRKAKVESMVVKNMPKAEKVAQLESHLSFDVNRDPERLCSGTALTQLRRIDGIDLEAAERRRSSSSAHERRIPLTGRDLHNIGRAIPAWCK